MSVQLQRLRPLEWTPLPDGTVRLRDPSRDEWVRTQGWTAGVLAAIDGGASFDAIMAQSAAGEDAPSAPRIRRFLLTLEKVGYVELVVPVPERLGPWQVKRQLGRGGVGIAYLCERDGTTAVAKRPWDFLHSLESARNALRREAEVLDQLDHPGIVRRLDLLEVDGDPVLVRDHVDGRPLLDHDGRPADRDRALALARRISDILIHLHERQLVLVDYKPSNFFLTPDDRIVLLDAGHCRAPGARRVGGTPGFMPPEFSSGGEATFASDVWGLGKLYAFLRTGRLPRPKVAGDSPLDGVPQEDLAALAMLCHEDPAQRPSSIADALAILGK